MSRQLKSKPSKRYRTYSRDALNNAVSMVRSKTLSLRQAAKSFNIPKTTLSYKINGKSEIGCRSGPATVLSAPEEDMIAEWAMSMAKMGFGRTRDELLDTVQKFVQKDGRNTPFTADRPGKDWYYGFLKRHPELSTRAPQQLAKERAVINQHRVEKWFRDFSEFMNEEVDDNLIWKDPTRWFNADESGFPLCPKSGKVLAPKGVPNVYNFTSSDKSQITVLACMNAAGLYLKPLIVFAGQRFNKNPLEDYIDAEMGRTLSGWMDSELFYTWLTDVFSPALDENSIKRPVVLFVDGHSTHCTLMASKFCRENNIILYCLLEHGSHLMQPCDISLFSALKSSWKQSVRDFQIQNVGEFVTKARFAGVFKSAWNKACSVDISVKGFRDSGLFPFDVQKVLGTLKLEPSKVFATPKIIQTQTSLGVNGPTSTTTTTELSESAEDNVSPSQSVSNRSATDTDAPEVTPVTIPITSVVSSSPIDIQVPASKSTKLAETGPAQASESHSAISPTVSPILQEILTLPVSKQVANKPAKKRFVLPKAISGKKFHDLLEKRQKDKEEENARKEARRKDREDAKKVREEERQKKANEREKKKMIRQQNVQEKENRKKIRQIEKMEKEKLKRKRQAESSESDISMDLEDDELADIDTSLKQACYACDAPYDNNTPDWIVCHKCTRWLHRACVKTIDLLSMTEEEIVDLEFECDYC